MNIASNYKPSHEEWMHWAQIVADRLDLCAQIYINTNHTLHAGVTLSERERQVRNGMLTTTLRRLYKLIDDVDTPTDSLADVAHHDEQVIDGLSVLILDILNQLPELSTDMQHILQSHWKENFTSPTARAVFFGAAGNGQDGVGSGYPENGRLPASLEYLILRERTQGQRKPRQDLVRLDDKSGRMESNESTRRRWADVNSRFMRRAGQVE